MSSFNTDDILNRVFSPQRESPAVAPRGSSNDLDSIVSQVFTVQKEDKQEDDGERGFLSGFLASQGRGIGMGIEGIGGTIEAAEASTQEEGVFDPRRLIRAPQQVVDVYTNAVNFLTGGDRESPDIGGGLVSLGRSITKSDILAPSESVANGGAFQPLNPRWWTERGGEFIPLLATQIGLAIATRGQGTGAALTSFSAPAAVQEGGLAFERTRDALVAQGEDEQTAGEVASDTAMFTAIGSAVLDRLAGSRLLFKSIPGSERVFSQSFMTKINSGIAGRAAAGFSIEGITELGQEAWADTMQFAATQDAQAFEDWKNRYPAAFALGGVAGAAVDVTTGAGGIEQPTLDEGAPDAAIQEEAQTEAQAVPQTDQPVIQEPTRDDQEAALGQVRGEEQVGQEPVQAGEQVGGPEEAAAGGVLQEQEEVAKPRQLEPTVPEVETVPTPQETQTEIDKARSFTRDGGFVDIGPVLNATKPVKAVGKTLAGVASEASQKVVDFAVVDLVDRVKRVGTPASIEASDLGRQAVDDSKAAFGRIQKTTDIALREAGKPTLKSQRAVFELQDAPRIDGTNYGIATIVDAVEGRVDVAGEAEKIVGSIRDLTFETGVLLEEVGLRQTNPSTGQKRNFRKTPEGKVFLRVPTSDMFGALMEGQGPIFDGMVEAFAHANQMDPKRVAEVFGQTRSESIEQGRVSAFKRINEEFARNWPKIPTHLYIGGDVVRLFETNPYLYAKRLAESTAARVGFIKNFGQSFQEDSVFNDLEGRIREEAGSVDQFVDMTRALNNVPVEKPFVESGSELAKVGRAIRSTRAIIETGLLSVSALPNISEPAGNIQAFSGSGDLMRAVTQLVKHPRATIDTLEQLGAVTKDVADLTIDPDRPGQSVGRISREAGGRVFLSRFINEFQEKLAATVGLNKVERMRNGKGSTGDAFDLRTMGFSRADAKRIAEGGGTEAEYAGIIRRTPAWLVGSPLAKSEKSRAENSRIVRASFAFLTYAQTKVRQFFGLGKAYVEDMTQAVKDRDFGAMKAPNQKMARYLIGTTASGAGAYMITSFAFGGWSGLKIAWEEAKDKPVRFMRDSFLYAMFAGPWGAVLRTMQDSNRLADNIIDMTFPGFVLTELADFFAGRKKYRDLSWLEGTTEVTKRFLPVHKVAKTMMAGIGFGERQHEMDTAIKGYWKWRFDEAKPTTSEPGQSDEAQQVFRANMKRAYNAIRKFKDPEEVLGHMVEAVASTGKDAASIRASIRSRKLLRPLTPEQIRAMRDRIGEDAFRVIVSHDLMLENWADAL